MWPFFPILCMHAQSCLTLLQPHRLWPTRLLCPWILQVRILEWVAIPLSRWSSWSRDLTHVSCIGRRILYHYATWEVPSLSCTIGHLMLFSNTYLKMLSSDQLLSHVLLFVTPRTAAHQASLSITNSRSLLKLMLIQLVMPSNRLIFCRPRLLPPSIFPSIRIFPLSQFISSGGQNIGVSASASVFPMNTQDWFPLVLTGWISLQSKRL